MRIYLKVIPRSSQSRLEKVGEGDFKAWVRSAPEKGRANEEVVFLLADFFKVSKNQVKIVGGKTSSKKIVDIKDFKQKQL